MDKEKRGKIAMIISLIMLALMIFFMVLFYQNLKVINSNPCFVCIEKYDATCDIKGGHYYLENGSIMSYSILTGKNIYINPLNYNFSEAIEND